MSAYYNEIEPFAVEWLRNLIAAGHIADGIVDDRSIVDVEPSDLDGFTQCHFFAGIGVWSHALRLAGWPDDRPVWTGSCPCQPFSVAGQQKGKDDDRHLAPHWLELITQCRPNVMFGEQVEAAIRKDWLDDLQVHLEAEDYACGAIVLPACSVGAPHLRQRLWFVAEELGNAQHDGHNTSKRIKTEQGSNGSHGRVPERGGGDLDGMPNAKREQRKRGWAGEEVYEPGTKQRVERLCDVNTTLANPPTSRSGKECTDAGRESQGNSTQGITPGCRSGSSDNELADTDSGRYQRLQRKSNAGMDQQGDEERSQSGYKSGDVFTAEPPAAGQNNGFWGAADWLYCRDGKWRPVEPIHAKMVDGAAPGMGYLCPESDKKKEVTHDDVPKLQQTADTEAVHVGGTGVAEHAEAPEILQPKMHGEGPAEAAVYESEPQPDESRSVEENVLRGLRESRGASCTPCERGPTGQLRIELEDVVRLLPQSLSLSELHGDGGTSLILQALCETICQEGAVQYAPEQVPAIWASFGEEAQNRIRMGFDASRWEIVVPFPLTKNAKSRVGRLRGYGNAIVPQVAAEVIKAYMETTIKFTWED